MNNIASPLVNVSGIEFVHGSNRGSMKMDDNPIFALMFAGYLSVMVALVGANVALMLLRVSHKENSRLAALIRRVGHRLSFLRLGGGNGRRHLSDHA
ncbi:hypothetical protein [Peteryoungia ipomoeae]|uniref:Uncharacterized protein n=1 Tax=Peteryoungia ipomoeae TaxID=1210932 RepID=A0A4S8P7B4_9HYPH|nr:hypothetical protein [Peteryoungia ipomoeae]THV23764.1 hypothetical protein FAA97_07190 [Peteryoungia ipomoeae]